MKYQLKLFTALTMLVFINVFFAYGQVGPNVKTVAAFERVKQEYASRSNDEKKLQFGTYELLRVAEASDTSGDAKQKFKDHLKIDKSLKVDSKDRIRVMIHMKSIDDRTVVTELIQSSDGIIEETYKDFPYILCKIHPKQLRNIVSSKLVINIRKNVEVITQTITSAGDAQLKADQARTTFSTQGANVNVGVISDGANDWNMVPSTEIRPVTVLHPGSGNEGTAMLEIIHDLAPEANLYFYGGINNYISFAQGIKTLSMNNCKIIVDDLGACDEPYFSDDDLAMGQTIRDFIRGGGVYVSSAGNNNYPGSPNIYVFSGTMNIGSVGELNVFPNGQPNGQTYLSCTVNAASSQNVFLEWANKWTMPEANYGLLINDNNGNLIYSNITGGDGSNPPQDIVTIYNNTSVTQTYQIAIKWIKGSLDPVDFKITCLAKYGTLSNNYTDRKQVFGHSGYPNVIGVAAYEASSQNTVSSYSSGGPLTMYSAENQTWAPQNTPFITATAGVQTWIGTNKNAANEFWWPGGNPNFSGTSAAAPHIAAIAALYFSAFSTNTLANFKDDLKMSADPIGGLGGSGSPWDARAGYGKANALACLTLAAKKVKTPIFDPPPSNFTLAGSLKVTITSESGAEIHYTKDGSTPSQSSFLYNGSSVNITVPCTLKAIAYLSGKDPSDIQTGNYIAHACFVTGKALTVDGQPISGVKIQEIHDGNTIGCSSYLTDANGEYGIPYRACNGYSEPCWDYQLQASKPGYVFSPIISGYFSQKSLGGVQNFTTCMVSGRVYHTSSSGLAGVQVKIEVADLHVRGEYEVEATVTTDGYGYYATFVPPGATRITPSMTGITFSPINRTIGTAGAGRGQDPNVGDNKINQDFYKLPAPPTALDADYITTTGFTAHWTPVDVDGVNKYYLDVAISDDWEHLLYKDILADGRSNTSCSVTGLNPNTRYMYRVRSSNGVQSPNSNIKAVTTASPFSATGGTITQLGGKTIHKFTGSLFSATGGTITYSGGKTIHTFTSSSGTFSCTGSGNVEVLVVGGGGGGGGSWSGGGGGAGGVVNNSSYSASGNITVTVGNGGNSMSNGGASVFGTLTANGGGAGGGYITAGHNGGCGGGAGGSSIFKNGGTGNQGYNGGTGYYRGWSRTVGGGGGGVVANGANYNVRPNGGAGLTYSISGTSFTYTYGGGGGGGCESTSDSPGMGGSGGGNGNTAGNGYSGTANTGGGGGGAGGTVSATGGNGGSGVVIVSYPTSSSSGTFSCTGSGNVEVLVVGGGGGGGGSWSGGGGGAGGVVNNSSYSASGNITVTVGNGGNSMSNGGASVFGTLTANGGGAGGGYITAGYNGGCGGGAGGSSVFKNGGTGNQGYNGGTGYYRGLSRTVGGGGGGAGANGANYNVRPNGGAGLTYSISGTSFTYTYGGGGGGGCESTSDSPGMGGSGGGNGNTAGNGYSGTANTGGGGGGAGGTVSATGGNGGSGVVIVSYTTGGLAKSSQGNNMVLAEELVSVPTEYGLSQNYPNPFNPTTNFEYRIANCGLVTLKVFDMLGREVVTLADGIKEPGYYKATFNASHLSSGIFFARLVAQSDEGKPFVQTIKLLLMK